MTDYVLEKQSWHWYQSNQFLILSAVLAVLLFFPASFEGAIHAAFILSMLILSGLTWIGHRTSIKTLRHYPIFWPILAMILAGMVATVLSTNITASINNYSRELALLLMFPLTAIVGRQKPRSLLQGLSLLLVAATILAAYGLFQVAIGLELTRQDLLATTMAAQPLKTVMLELIATRRSFSLFAYPNLFGGFLVLIIPLNLLLIHLQRSRKKVVWLIVLTIHLLALISTGSFGSWLSALLGCFIFYTLYPMSTKLKSIIMGIGLLVGIIGFTWLVQHRSLDALALSLQGRWQSWKMIFTMLEGNWLVGVGPGCFGQAFSQLAGDQPTTLRFAHQFILQQLAEKGLLGVLAFLWLLKSIIVYLVKHIAIVPSNQLSIIKIALIASITSSLMHAMIDIDAEYLKTSMLLWMMVGLLVAISMPMRSEVSERDQSVHFGFVNPRVMSLGLMLSLIGVLLYKGGKSYLAEGVAIVIVMTCFGLLLIRLKMDRLLLKAYWEQWPMKWIWFWLLCWTMLAIINSPHPWLGLSSLWLLAAGGLAVLVGYYSHRFDDWFIWLLRMATILMAGLTIIDWFHQPGVRAAGGWPTSNLMAAFLAAGIMIHVIHAWMVASDRRQRLIGWLATWLLSMALLMTGSFAGLLNALVGLALIVVWKNHLRKLKKVKIALLALGAIFLIIFLPFHTGQRLKQLENYHDQAYERLSLLKSGLAMIQDHRWLGIGPGHFLQTFEQYKFPDKRGLARYGHQAQFVHNELIQIAVVIGLPGLALIIWLVLGLIRRWLVFWQVAQDRSEHYRVLMSWSLLAGALIHSLFDFNWNLPLLFIIYMTAIGHVMRSQGEGQLSLQAVLEKSDNRLPLRTNAGQLLMLLLLVSGILVATRPVINRYLIDRGITMYQQNQLKQAAISFEQAISLTPLSATTYDKLGRVQQDYYSIHQIEQWLSLAEWSFLKSIHLNPGNYRPYRHLASLYHQRALQAGSDRQASWFQKAQHQYQQASKRAPYNAVIYFEMGNVLRDAGQLSAAKQAWQVALQIEPHYAAAASNLGVVCELLELPDEAKAAYRRALKARPFQNDINTKLEMELFSLNWAVVYFNLAALLDQQGRLIEAKQAYLQVLAIEPQNKLALEQLMKLEKKL